MDSVSRPEFGKIFRRVSSLVDLQGAFTAQEIENRMNLASQAFKDSAQSRNRQMWAEIRENVRLQLARGGKPTPAARQIEQQMMKLRANINRALAAQARYHADQLNKLVEHDFGGRAIYEAGSHPRGPIMRALIHGTEMTDYRLLAQKSAQARAGGPRTREEAKARRARWMRLAGA